MTIVFSRNLGEPVCHNSMIHWGAGPGGQITAGGIIMQSGRFWENSIPRHEWVFEKGKGNERNENEERKERKGKERVKRKR